jgi:hypothetical protein
MAPRPESGSCEVPWSRGRFSSEPGVAGTLLCSCVVRRQRRRQFPVTLRRPSWHVGRAARYPPAFPRSIACIWWASQEVSRMPSQYRIKDLASSSGVPGRGGVTWSSCRLCVVCPKCEYTHIHTYRGVCVPQRYQPLAATSPHFAWYRKRTHAAGACSGAFDWRRSASSMSVLSLSVPDPYPPACLVHPPPHTTPACSRA